MILSVKCVECGKEGKVLILFKLIFSWKWWYFPEFTKLGIEYWECKECRKRQ